MFNFNNNNCFYLLSQKAFPMASAIAEASIMLLLLLGLQTQLIPNATWDFIATMRRLTRSVWLLLSFSIDAAPSHPLSAILQRTNVSQFVDNLQNKGLFLIHGTADGEWHALR